MISLGVPLLRPSVFSGVVSAGGTGTITLQQSAQAINFSTLIMTTVPYYIEVVGHADGVTNALVGERFEVNELTSASNANNVLSIDTASSLNTISGSDFASLANYRVVIRPHWTLASLFGTGLGTNLNASTSILAADQVLAWNGSSFSIFYFRSGSVPQWRNSSTGVTPQDSAIIPPGVGVFFRRAAGAYSQTVVGDVRTNKFVRLLDGTSQLIANGFPVDVSPSDLLQNVSSGYIATTSAVTADQLLTWNGVSYSIYYYRSGTVPQWRNTSTGTTDHTSTKLYTASGAVLYRPKGLPDDIAFNVPFSL
jgi:hypothetical protein